MKSFLKNIALSIVSLVVFAALVELLFLALYGPTHSTHGDVIARREKAGHALLANVDRTHAGKRVVTNELGLRDPRPPHTSADSTQILILGDSFTFGFGVEDEDSYPRQLERLLNDAAGEEGYIVINAGVPGYSTFHELRLLTRILPHYSPRWVVVGFHPGDVAGGYRESHADPVPIVEEGESAKETTDAKRGSGSFRIRGRNFARKWTWRLKDRSSFFSWLYRVYKTWLIQYVPPPRAFTWHSDAFLDPNQFQGTKSALTGIRDMAAEHDARVAVFMIVPLLNWKAYPYRPLHAGMAEFCEQNDMAFVDPLSAFSQHSPGKLWAAINDAHYSPEANRIAAGVLRDFLLAQEAD